jgi:hypothetical protein
MNKQSHILISCSFGTKFTSVYPCPSSSNSYFFTNNPIAKKEIESSGWIYKYVASKELSEDFFISSSQSKYIKFLQFFSEFPELEDVEEVTYFDHKFNLKQQHLDWIKDHFQQDKSILIRYTPRLKLSIEDEITDAMNDTRYSRNMDQTRRWLEEQISREGVTMENRIMNTGLISYRNLNSISKFLNSVYAATQNLQQPECQIIWAALAQKISHDIQKVEWNSLNPQWAAPEPSRYSKLFSRLLNQFK